MAGGMNFTADLRVGPTLSMSIAVTLIPIYSCMVCTWITLTFTLILKDFHTNKQTFCTHFIVLWCVLVLLHQVKQFALVLWSRDLNPDKYETLCRMLSKTYCKTGSPVSLLQLYLSVVTRGSCTTEENGTFLVRDFEVRSNHNNHMPNTRVRGQSFQYHWRCV